MTTNYHPIVININPQNLYIAAGLGILVLIMLAVISSIKTKQISQAAINKFERSYTAIGA